MHLDISLSKSTPICYIDKTHTKRAYPLLIKLNPRSDSKVDSKNVLNGSYGPNPQGLSF